MAFGNGFQLDRDRAKKFEGSGAILNQDGAYDDAAVGDAFDELDDYGEITLRPGPLGAPNVPHPGVLARLPLRRRALLPSRQLVHHRPLLLATP